MAHHKYYAVYQGRQGTQIYTSWDEAKANVSRVSNVKYKSFRSSEEAQAWLQGVTEALAPPQAPASPYEEIGAMDVDDDDIELLDGPPPNAQWSTPTRTPSRTPVSENASDYDYDSDIEILPGPPAGYEARLQNGSASSTRSASRAQSATLSSISSSDRERSSAPPQVLQNDIVKTEEQTANGLDALAPVAPAPDIQLSPDQLYVLGKVKNGESVFFTGSAGTGKSVLLRKIIEHFGGHPSKTLGVTASTGIASINIGGCTLHSWAGIGLGKDDADGLVGKILGIHARAYKADLQLRRQLWARKNRGERLDEDELAFLHTDPSETCKSKVLDRWRNVKTLIIDEISMIDGKLFDKLEYVARQLRKNALPFGGIQLVLSGDFCQLPPVPDKSGTGAQIAPCFAFDSESWEKCVGPPIILQKVFRQKDQKFVDMLNAMRFGRLDGPTTTSFRLLARTVKYNDDLLPTELYPKRSEVESANAQRLAMIEGESRPYRALDTAGRDENGEPYPRQRVERALNDMIALPYVHLKVGAQVMLIKNIIQGVLVNGSLGRVVGFYRPREAVAMGAIIGLPENRGDYQGAQQLIRSQGQGQGQAGRAGGSGGSGHLTDALGDPQREQKIKAILALNTLWPCVQFQSGPLMLCVPLSFEVINAEGNIEAVREQIPLILAWALSIHKSQGQTLERVRVDLNNIFEKGQAYVALSRATRMESLQVLNFDPSKVRAHPRVLQWMAQYMDKPQELPYIRDEPDNDIDDELEYWADMIE